MFHKGMELISTKLILYFIRKTRCCSVPILVATHFTVSNPTMYTNFIVSLSSFLCFHISFLYLSEWFINRERFLSGTHPPFTHLSDPKYVTFIIIPLHFIWDQDVVRYSQKISPRPPYHLYDLFNNASHVGDSVGNETMSSRRLIAPPTRKITRIRGRERMIFMTCPMTLYQSDSSYLLNHLLSMVDRAIYQQILENTWHKENFEGESLIAGKKVLVLTILI